MIYHLFSKTKKNFFNISIPSMNSSNSVIDSFNLNNTISILNTSIYNILYTSNMKILLKK